MGKFEKMPRKVWFSNKGTFNNASVQNNTESQNHRTVGIRNQERNTVLYDQRRKAARL